MGFVSVEEVLPHVAVSIKKVLADTTTFTALETECAKIIRDKTGQPIPENGAARPDSADWVVLPAAWIIQYMASNQTSGNNAESEARHKNQYTEAIKILDAHPLRQEKSPGVKTPRKGCIEGMYE